MNTKSPGVFRVAIDYVNDNFLWAVNTPLYHVYYLIFIGFGTAGIWFEYVFPVTEAPNRDFFETLASVPLLTFSAPMIVAILAKHILIGIGENRSDYPMKTLRSFSLVYFIIVIILFVKGLREGSDEASWYSISAVIMLLIFQYFYGAKDKDYEDVSLDVSDRAAGNNKHSLKGNRYE